MKDDFNGTRIESVEEILFKMMVLYQPGGQEEITALFHKLQHQPEAASASGSLMESEADPVMVLTPATKCHGVTVKSFTTSLSHRRGSVNANRLIVLNYPTLPSLYTM